MKTLTTLLAWRYIYGSQQEKNIAFMAKICFTSIMIASWSLALILFIMQGFEQVTHQKLQGIHAQIIIRAYGDALARKPLTDFLHREFPAIEAISPTSMTQAVITSDASYDITNIVIIKAIDPSCEAKTTTLENKITKTITTCVPKLTSLIHTQHIIIGSSLAQTLQVKPGDTITFLCINEEQSHKRSVAFKEHKAVISGIFSTGIEEFDTSVAYCSFDLMETMIPNNGITQVNIRLKAQHNEDEIIHALRDRLGLEVISWKELYPALVSALKLEKYAMLCILLLIVIVACTNIISLEFMHIAQKRKDIALLKSMGMQNCSLQKLFIMVGSSIACLGTCVGILLACISGIFIQQYPFITLPDTYYATQLPIHIELSACCLVFILVMVVSISATWFPTWAIRSISLTKILRSET